MNTPKSKPYFMTCSAIGYDSVIVKCNATSKREARNILETMAHEKFAEQNAISYSESVAFGCVSDVTKELMANA